MMEDEEDARLACEAWEAFLRSGERTIPLEDVMRMFGMFDERSMNDDDGRRTAQGRC